MTAAILFLLTVHSPSDLPSWCPPELEDSAKYELTYPKDFQRLERWPRLSFKLKQTGEFLNIEVGASSPVDAQRRIVMQQDPPSLKETSFSGVPIGRQTRATSETGHLDLWAVNRHERVHANLTSPLVKSGRFRQNRPDDLSPHMEWLEAISRRAMARFAARRAGSEQNLTIGSRAVATFVASETRTTMVDLSAWATARGVSLNENPTARRTSFSFRGQAYVFALGTDKCKIGGSWVSMSDIVMEHQDKTWVPLSFLEQ